MAIRASRQRLKKLHMKSQGLAAIGPELPFDKIANAEPQLGQHRRLNVQSYSPSSSFCVQIRRNLVLAIRCSIFYCIIVI